MNLRQIERSETIHRDEIARRLHALADALARRSAIEFDRGGALFRLKVPDEVRLKVELEVNDGETELETEPAW